MFVKMRFQYNDIPYLQVFFYRIVECLVELAEVTEQAERVREVLLQIRKLVILQVNQMKQILQVTLPRYYYGHLHIESYSSCCISLHCFPRTVVSTYLSLCFASDYRLWTV
jgi:hypothetical protein